MPPNHIARDVHAYMPRAGSTRRYGGGFTFIRRTGNIKARRESQNRRSIDARHGGQHRR